MNSPCAFTSPGMLSGGKAEWPYIRVRCNPTPRLGFSRASATASSQAGSFTIRLAVVRMPSRCARITASLIEAERPKSSALTISRRGVESGLGRLGAIAWRRRPGNEPAPGAQDEQRLLAPAQARALGAEDVEPLGSSLRSSRQ